MTRIKWRKKNGKVTWRTRRKAKQGKRHHRTKHSASRDSVDHVRPIRGGQQHTAGGTPETLPGTWRLTRYWAAGIEHHVVLVGPQHQFRAEEITRLTQV